MFKFVNDIKEMKAKLKALNKSQATIEFKLDGTIITANDLFLNVVGYSLNEIRGKHHSLFVDPAYKNSIDYQQFWAQLNAGEYLVAEYKRIGKGGKEVWIQASYNPILDSKGKPYKVVKFASDVTVQKLTAIDFKGQIEAINKSQAVIEFNMDGTVIWANNLFLGALGYSLDEIKGKHHSLFVEASYRNSQEYQQFWVTLNRGEYQAAQYKRIGKGGKEVWIQASYNPIFDTNGKPFKVVKYATDISEQVATRLENESGMKQCIAILRGISAGDLREKMQGNYLGAFAEIKTALNATIERLGESINESVSVLQGVASGDLTSKVTGDYQGTFADIKNAVNGTIDRLSDTVKGIVVVTQAVNSAASEIASGSADLSMRTEQQASNLEETAASMEEITGTVRQNSQNAGTANELSTKASAVANEGGKVVEDAVTAMASIEKSSQKISDIIGVIDEIAFQTNLLALNAAVEAARAGDAGKGFAVVASEVRSLAGRSASASKEIKALINESAHQVKSGAELVNQAGGTLKNIVGSVKQVANIVSEIASASAQQATGIDEINAAVTQMDEMTQQNAALVEENTAATQSMLEQTKNLENLIGFFRVDQTGERVVESAKPAAKPVVRPAARPVVKPVVRKPVTKTPALAALKANANKSVEEGWEEF